MTAEPDASTAKIRERREPPERRRRLLHALFIGALSPRRHTQRRGDDSHSQLHDLHEARWLAVAMLIMLLSVGDAMLTVRLLDLGAIEVNPVMATMLSHSSPAFAYLKVALTALGVIILVVMARLRAFGRLPVSVVLYAILGLYGALIAYELWLLEALEKASTGPT